MCQVFEQHITNTSIRVNFYNIPTIKNQISLRQLTCLGKIFCQEYSRIPTLLLTVWCDHPCEVGWPILTNKQCMVRNIRQVISYVEANGALSTWRFHALESQNWNDLLNTIKHPSFEPPCQVFEQHITNTSIRVNFYNIPTIKNQISLRQLPR